jgi:hypothetical protein
LLFVKFSTIMKGQDHEVVYLVSTRHAGHAVSTPNLDTDERWYGAIDWLLNSRHTADPDIQGPFWAYCDGLITRDELDHFSASDVLEREAELAKSKAVES